MSIDFNQLRRFVVRPVLQHLDDEIAYSMAAENLVIGTIAQESHGSYLRQLGQGPAMGMIQMEPATHDDIWANFLAYHPRLAKLVRDLELPNWYGDDATELTGNLYYCAAMCRCHYRRVPDALPGENDISGLAKYWKSFYNTYLGAGTEDEFIRNYSRT